MKSSVPSLTIDGFITNKRSQMSKIWEYFLASEFSQSNIFHGGISSFKYIMATNKPSNELITDLEQKIKSLFQRYYDTAIVDVDMKLDDKTNTHYVTIAVACKDDDGKTYHLAKEIAYTNGKIENFEREVDRLYEHYIGIK